MSAQGLFLVGSAKKAKCSGPDPEAQVPPLGLAEAERARQG